MKKILSGVAITILIIACKKPDIGIEQEEIASTAANKKPVPVSANPAITYKSLFSLNRNRSVPALFVMDANGANKTKVYTNYNAQTTQRPDFPTWSPDGTKLCFNLNESDLYTLSITVVNGVPTASNATKIADGVAEGGSYRKGVWNPSASANEIAVVWQQSSQPSKIRIIPANGSVSTTLYTSPGTDHVIDDQISFSPDGSKLAITERQTSAGINTLKIIDRSTGNVSTTADLSQFLRITGLDWANSTGSMTIAFTAWPLCSVNGAGLRKLYSIDMADATPAATLLSDNERDGVSWAPDDLKIASMGGGGLGSVCNPANGCCVRYYSGIHSFTLSTQGSTTINLDWNAVNPDWKN